ncbi:MAG: Ig-like domain-containing protein [Gemmatimonadaceae bacterium]
MRAALGLITAAIAALAAACGEGGGAGPDAAIVNIFIAAPVPSIAVGEKVQLSVAAIDAAGNAVTTSFEWSATPNTVAAVSSRGEVTGVSAGNATISARAGGKVGTLSLAVRSTPNLAVVTMPPGDVFVPFQVIIPQGGTVRWEFPQRAHNVIFDRIAGAPQDIQATANAAVSRTFAGAGLFPYDCTLHPGMAGEVLVR